MSLSSDDAPDYQRVFASSPASLLLLAPTPDFTILDASDNYLKATMTDRAVIVGHGLFEAFPDNPDDVRATGVRNLRASLERVLTAGDSETMPAQQYDIRRPDGSFEPRYWSAVNTAVLADDGSVRWIVHRVEDAAASLAPSAPAGLPRVLVAGDHADMRDYLARVIGWSYLVETVADGATAWERIQVNAPDLVVADVALPQVDGLSLVSRIRADPRHRALPVVLLSARADEEVRAEALRAGADDYLVTPFSARELLASIAAQLRLQRLRNNAGSASAYLAAIVDSADDAILAKDLDGVIQSCNAAAERLFGYTASELIGQPVRILIPADRQSEEDDILLKLRRGERIAHFETVRLRKDGSPINISLTISPVRDATGAVIGASKIARDITALKQAEAERLRLLEENANVTATLNKVGAMVASDLDRDKVLQAVTDAGTELTTAEFGAFFYNVVDNRGESYGLYTVSGARRDAFADLPMPRTTAVFEPTFHGTAVVRSDDITKDPRYGHNAPFFGVPKGHIPVRSYLAVPVKGRAGEVIGGLLFAHGSVGRFTEHHERLAAGVAAWASVALENASLYTGVQEASRVKDEFLASLSHELRTPLNAILGYARMLRSGIMPPERQRKAIDTIERNATSLTQIVEDVLDISRIVSGKIRLNVQPVELPDIVRHAVDAVGPAADAKGIRLETVIDPQATPVSGDPERLQQILWNLLSNAVKFTNRGGRVQVRLARVNSHVEASVTDTGIGISPEFLPHVFERFRQADASTTRERGGLGLGLSIARQLTEIHGGSLDASSAGLGQGATFRLTIPLLAVYPVVAPVTRVHPAAGSLARDIPPDMLQHVHVLAVDDEKDAVTLVAEVLEAAGARVTTARSVREAITKLETEPPDVVVADLGMPHMDGFDFIQRIRRHDDASIRDIPAAALTAYARSEDRMKALKAGFQIHLAKPIDPAELVTTVAALAKRFSARE